jgi:hypothetical protein
LTTAFNDFLHFFQLTPPNLRATICGDLKKSQVLFISSATRSSVVKITKKWPVDVRCQGLGAFHSVDEFPRRMLGEEKTKWTA